MLACAAGGVKVGIEETAGGLRQAVFDSAMPLP
jgi:hypothetical protein